MLARVFIGTGRSTRVAPKGSPSEISSVWGDSAEIIIVGMADHVGWACRMESNRESVSKRVGGSERIIAAAPRSS
jgi:hypothetical protein